MGGVPYRALGDAVVLLHLGFIAFAITGALFVRRRRWVAWLHVPAVAWAAIVEIAGQVCPLTPLELWLRSRAGGPVYRGDFVEHYVMPILYPARLTRGVQIGLGLAVLVLNVVLYARALAGPRR